MGLVFNNGNLSDSKPISRRGGFKIASRPHIKTKKLTRTRTMREQIITGSPYTTEEVVEMYNNKSITDDELVNHFKVVITDYRKDGLDDIDSIDVESKKSELTDMLQGYADIKNPSKELTERLSDAIRDEMVYIGKVFGASDAEMDELIKEAHEGVTTDSDDDDTDDSSDSSSSIISPMVALTIGVVALSALGYLLYSKYVDDAPSVIDLSEINLLG